MKWLKPLSEIDWELFGFLACVIALGVLILMVMFMGSQIPL